MPKIYQKWSKFVEKYAKIDQISLKIIENRVLSWQKYVKKAENSSKITNDVEK